MNDVVLDASMALAWLFERQQPKERDCADRALLALAHAKTWVPSLWYTEVANALLVGERRRVVTESQTFGYLSKLSALPITTDPESPLHRRDAVIALAREHQLSAYDATYLDLALRTNAVLATFDGQLANAMRRAGGSVFGDE